MNHFKYRPDIDGLRGVAVLMVIFFHVGFTTFSGGFVGVDIFFVISGFLITQQIHDDVKDGTFSFARFYERRARRILPALFFTFIVSLIAAYYLLAPNHMTLFGGSLFHALTGVSNIFFWIEDDYFSPGAEFKPLLHTWSLSVEEQFYLFWPIVLLLLLKHAKRGFSVFNILSVGIGTLIISEIKLDEDPAAVFYLTQYRIMEFAFGAVLVWLIPNQPRNRLVLEPLALAGLAMIFLSALIFTKETAFPGFNSILPCFGAALLIYSGTANYSGRVLNNPLLVRVGIISYSLYLIHWPIYVFYKYYQQMQISTLEVYAVIGVSIMTAFCMHRFIETPFRRKALLDPMRTGTTAPGFLSASAIGLGFAMLALLLSVPAANIWKTNGWEWRFKGLTLLKQGDVEHFEHWRRVESEIAKDVEFDGLRIPVIFEGDSQAEDLYLAMKDDEHFQMRRLEDHNSMKIDDIKMAKSFIYTSLNTLKNGQEKLRETFSSVRRVNPDISIFLFGPKPHLSDINLTLINRSDMNLTLLVQKDINATVNKYLNMAKADLDSEIKALRSMADNLGATFVDVHQIYCEGGCIFYGSDKFAYIDTIHWTRFGMQIFYKNFKNTHEYKQLTGNIASLADGETSPGKATQTKPVP